MWPLRDKKLGQSLRYEPRFFLDGGKISVAMSRGVSDDDGCWGQVLRKVYEDSLLLDYNGQAILTKRPTSDV